MISWNVILTLTLLINLIVRGKSAFTSTVETHNGPVRGEILTTIEKGLQYAAFKGIPYAKPPVGKLRFKPPEEKEAWSDVLNATSEGSMCTQFNSTENSVVGSEDCLYLNVFTPHTNFDTSKPVMVWIHGGAYRTGNSNASYYGPDFLLGEDVIVVSLNYRLGPLGFLNLNHDGASGNYGLKDQNLALKWVKKNIANFGGNPEKVTLFGQSAGSVSVALHLLSDMSSGLFSQTIAMSGSPLCLYWGFQTAVGAEKQAFLLGSKLGTNTASKDTLLETLYNASAADLVYKTHDIPLLPFRPTIESISVDKDQEKFLTECSLKKYHSGDYNKGPHVMGFTSEETVAFAGSASNLLDMADAALSTIKTATLDIDLPILSNIAALTLDGVANLTEDALYEIVKQTTDLFFFTGIDSTQKWLNVHNNNPIYYYRFSFDSNYSAHRSNGVDLDGVGHEDELPYLFYRPHINLPLDKPDIKLTRERMVRLWTNFAKYGNPTPEGHSDDVLGVQWPDSGVLGRHLEINEDLSVGSRPIPVSVKAYQLAGLGASPILNDCPKNIITKVVKSIENIIG